MSQADPNSTVPDAERYPDVTFCDPYGAGHDGDALENAANVAAFLRYAMSGPDEPSEDARCGLSVILGGLEHSLRSASKLVPKLRADMEAAQRDYMTAYMHGHEDSGRDGLSPSQQDHLARIRDILAESDSTASADDDECQCRIKTPQ